MATKRTQLTKLTKDQLIEKFQEVEAQVSAQAAVTTPAAATATKEHATKTRAAVQSFSLDTFVADLQAKVDQLKAIQDAIDVETAELERLYQLDVVSATTQALIAEHQETISNLTNEQMRARAAWQEEVAAHNKEVAQRNAEAQLQRTREANDYAYRINQERQRAEDEYKRSIAESRRQHELAMAAERAEFDKMEAELEAQKHDYVAALNRIAQLDSEIKKASDTAVAIATNSLKKDLTNQFALERKDLELANRLETQKVASAAAEIQALRAENQRLQAQLESARNEVREIAKSAVEGASGQLALSKVMEVRNENTNGKSKS